MASLNLPMDLWLYFVHAAPTQVVATYMIIEISIDGNHIMFLVILSSLIT
jgi:hypothetical protein